jgi:photosystem II stability/assembly factor-like uncharacterized protein
MKKLTLFTAMILFGLSVFSATWQDALKRLHPVWSEVNWMIRENAWKTRTNMVQNSPFACIPFNVVGPMAQGGRIMDLAMDENLPTTWMVAYATGGVWITHDDGHNWKPLFDNQPAFSVGAIAAVWGDPGVPRTLWVGTGEPSNTRTVYMGAGLFKSEDQGKTWERSAVPNAQHIGRIAIHPERPETVFVAALGPVYTDGGERGLYRTRDNGKTWKKIIDCPPFTGVVDVMIDFSDPDTVFACTWERRRKAWDFRENGPGSGIWKSTDGGDTFTRLAGGLPDGNGLGRIGLSQSRLDPKKIYAIVDNQSPRPVSKDNPEPLLAKEFQEMDQKAFLKLPDKRIDNFLRLYQYPEKMTAETIRKEKDIGQDWFANMKIHIRDMKDIPYFWPKCIGPELYRSLDGGLTWKKTHTADLRTQVDWGYGTATYYCSRIAVDPSNDDRVLLTAVPLIETRDGGKTFQYADKNGHDVHADHHIILFDSRNPKRVIVGNDGGLNLSLDGGVSWRPVKNIPVAQCYTVTYDMSTPYRIFSGLQDNGISMGYNQKIKSFQQIDSWKEIWGADGMFVQVNPLDNNTAYLGTQFGDMWRVNLHTRKSADIRPRPSYPQEEPFRTNWVTPIVMSRFHPDIVYTGTQFVHRSFDGGKTWEIISPDLTSEGQEGSFVNVGNNISYGNISALAESPKRFGLLYAGTDEGWVWVSRDAGLNWTRCTDGIPGNKWVTRLEPGCHKEEVVFATFTGFRENDTTAYVFKSSDFGKTWTSIKGNLPDECMNVIRQNPINPDLLFAGSDFGVYVSLDGGKHWDAIGSTMPGVPAYDLCVHPREGDLIIGTYGRSVWTGSVKALQEYTADIRDKNAHLFRIGEQKAQEWWEKEKPVEVGEPREIKTLDIYYHVKNPGPVRVDLLNKEKKILRTWRFKTDQKLNRFEWDFLIDKKFRKKLPEGRRPFVLPGNYTLKLTAADGNHSIPIKIKEPEKPKPWWEEDQPGSDLRNK